ncbi:sigma-70 family RNA polymerase sigma factor [Pyxidicoccus fallax]|uniref:Sigma-70 family RNA polymerase sigma factor n=1 Tax=Pyxidicoccus fallax TaxID=394095 RepID=A0A848LIJ3_9BACT|nr:sigma-70 family RNA polymerase sigma factor [Pyxidicoccus fallax]NMO17528.1 sigma-70 family RNA polymerase sigma factor [Pyxidicoccus fallax]NPC81545.1 sigma-70 family RNA polymerase sigma factor [Pyxidicoccus fallax]
MHAPSTHLPFLGWVSELARTHTRDLTRVAQREGLSAEDALDALQEAFHTFLMLPRARTLSGEREDAHALLSVLVRNTARNMRRRHHRAVPHESAEALEALGTQEPGVDELLTLAEDHVKLHGCVSRLNEVQRHVVTLRMLEELSGAEVAQALSLTPGNVAVLLHRAKAELQRCVMG